MAAKQAEITGLYDFRAGSISSSREQFLLKKVKSPLSYLGTMSCRHKGENPAKMESLGLDTRNGLFGSRPAKLQGKREMNDIFFTHRLTACNSIHSFATVELMREVADVIYYSSPGSVSIEVSILTSSHMQINFPNGFLA